ncbi:MAG: hypothetical protein WBM25_01620, partial [Azonexus sp.]
MKRFFASRRRSAIGRYPKETLIYPSHRRKPVSSTLIFLDSGMRRNDVASGHDKSGINQRIQPST